MMINRCDVVCCVALCCVLWCVVRHCVVCVMIGLVRVRFCVGNSSEQTLSALNLYEVWC